MIDRRAFAKGALVLPWLAQAGALLANEQAGAKQWAIGFAPPVGTPLFATTKTLVHSGRAGEIALTVERQYQFEHLGRGFRLVSTLTGITDNAPPQLSRMLRVGIDPLQGLAIAFNIDASGQRIEVEDLAGTWEKVAAAVARIAASADQPHRSRALTQNIASIDDAGRRTLLLNEVYDLIRYAGRGDVMGHAAASGMVSIVEPAQGDWMLTGAVHQFSGLSWTLDKARIGATPPRHGIAGSKMQIRI